LEGRLVDAKLESLFRAAQILGAPAAKLQDIPQAIKERRQSLWRQCMNPVIVAWDGKFTRRSIRLPHAASENLFRSSIEMEDGTVLHEVLRADPRDRPASFDIEGQTYFCQHLELSHPVPLGYHHLNLEIGNESFRSLIISAPTRFYTPESGGQTSWGLFLPLYALWSESGWGSGNFSDLKRLVRWTTGMGGKLLGTLPLHALSLDEPFDPSPYSPVSRLFWNEFYLDLAQSPELAQSDAALALVNSSDFQREIALLRAERLIDYPRHMALRRRVLEELTRSFFSRESARYSTFLHFLESHPALVDYARFRAALEIRNEPWSRWAEGPRNGTLKEGDYSESAKQYHLYAQWLADEQIKPLREAAGAGALYLDFPLGVHRDGYDVWREREVFALEASGGAPPDDFFVKGQNWGFPPLHPEKLRQHGYRYYVACLRHQLKYASQLRIDHVMGLHRLYWIPHGFEATEGVYVRYPAAEFYALLSLESHRHRAVIVGENLGTVPESVRDGMQRHGIYGMNVGQFAVRPNSEFALEKIPPLNIASLNTHDTATFAGYWHGHDIEDRRALGLLTEEERITHAQSRARLRECLTRFLQTQGWLPQHNSDPSALLKAWLSYIASEPVALLLVNLEDLWLEEKPQNVPGTWRERPNWRRKALYSMEQFCRMAQVSDILGAIDRIRKQQKETTTKEG
jgi:4-alpha-glucanotransferase